METGISEKRGVCKCFLFDPKQLGLESKFSNSKIKLESKAAVKFEML